MIDNAMESRSTFARLALCTCSLSDSSEPAVDGGGVLGCRGRFCPGGDGVLDRREASETGAGGVGG